MGVVYRVHDPALKRTLAVKVLQHHHQDNLDLKRRFLEEAELMAQLQHPGIAPLHDVGELPDGRPYFSMKLIRGRTLAQLLQERPSPTHDLPGFLAIFGQLCQTLAYAHNRRILHRDLKPSNVMVGAFGEVQVMDWGLAKVLDSERTSETGIQLDDASAIAPVRTAGEDLATHVGAILGTPAFMAPEQARGEIEQLDERADVFGLGAILCVLLTGQPPYVGLTKAEVYRQAKEAALTDAWARLEACGADDDLVQLAKACLTPDRAERPRHAGVVAEAVAAYQAQVQQRLQQAEVARAQALVKVQEERKRRRVTLALATAVVVLLLGGSITGGWYLQEAAQQQRRLGEAQQGIEASLTEASKLREVGLQQVDNPSAWGVTLAAARTALEHARTLLTQEPDLAETGLAQQMRQGQAELEGDAKDWRLLSVFDQVRLEQSQWDVERSRFKRAESYPRMAKALSDYGLAIGDLEPSQAVGRLRQRPPVVQKQLLALLEECRTCAPAEASRPRQWLAAVLALEADPWLMQFRQAVARQAWTQVEQVLGQADFSRYHPAVLVGLAASLPAKAGASAMLLLRRTQRQYPGDSWANYFLGVALFHPGILSGQPHRPDPAVLREAVGFYRVAVGLRPGSVAAHNDLGNVLFSLGDLPGAIACYQKALELDPKLALAYYNLGNVLRKQGDLAGAITRYHKALDLDPRSVRAHYGIGVALQKQGDRKGALAHFQKALDLDPGYAPAHSDLGLVLKAEGNLKGAIESFSRALALDPRYAPAHTNLGMALAQKGDRKGSVQHLQKALDLDPRNAPAHLGLGIGLAGEGNLWGALGHFQKALEIDPKYALAHTVLGRALAEQGDRKGAIASYTRALQLDPRDPKAHYELGRMLMEQGDLAGAIEHFHDSIALDPNYAHAHNNLGLALGKQGDLNGAIACYRKALELDPKYAEAHCNLGHALRRQGHFAKALKALKRGHELGSQRPGWRFPSARWVEECQRLLDLDARLPAILKGEDQPKDAAEQLTLADLCGQYKQRYVEAFRFYAAAFVAQPKLAENVHDGARYNAARAATLAGCGKGKDADQLEAKERARLRRQALDWLRADLVVWSKQLEGADAKTHQALQKTLQHWQKDPDLASVRDADALTKLPETERAAWQQLWAEVAAMLKKTQE
jgi:serine/threonine-protein kinase